MNTTSSSLRSREIGVRNGDAFAVKEVELPPDGRLQPGRKHQAFGSAA
ncbi:MAG TPA: hypothetical protein VF834_01060 [Streptosporangiaceae bacterium]